MYEIDGPTSRRLRDEFDDDSPVWGLSERSDMPNDRYDRNRPVQGPTTPGAGR